MRISVLFYIFSAGLFFANSSFSACTVSTTELNFGNYDALSAIATDSTGSISVVCSPKEDITIALGASPNSGGFNPRQMKSTSLIDLLNYNVYTTAGRAKIWGDGTGGTETADRNNVDIQSFTVFGRIPPLQNVSGDTYADTLTVTVYLKGTSTVLASSNITVIVNVIPSCSVTNTAPVSFGVYDPLSITDNIAGAGSFTFVCGVDSAYQLHIAGTRQMSDGGGNVLNYEIFTDMARTVVWPASTPSSEAGTATSGVYVTRSVYGKIFASQDVPPGAYTSTLSVTVTY